MENINKKIIIWLIPFVILLIGFLFDLRVIPTIFLLILSTILCFILSNIKKKENLLVVKKDNLNTVFEGIVVGKKGNNLYLSDKKNILIVDKNKSNDFLNVNIDSISSFKNKPNMIVIDEKQELYNDNYESLKRKKYSIERINLSNIIIEPFKIINHKIYNIKELESKVDNYKGQYLTTNEVYLSYDEIRLEIKKIKDEIIDIIEKFIQCYYLYDRGSKEFLVIKGMFLYFIEECIYYKNFVELSIEEVFTKINVLSSININKLKRCFQKTIDEDFMIKENLKEIKNTLELSNICQKIIVDTNNLKNQKNSMKVYEVENLFFTNQVLFVSEIKRDLLELFMMMLDYGHYNSDIYLLTNVNANYELFSNQMKIIHVVTEIKEIEDFDKYSLKVYRGKVNNENKKEVLRLCKTEVDDLDLKEYNQIFNLLRVFDKMNIDKEEILIIKSTKESFITSFEVKKSYKNLGLKYIKKN